jgi:SAM-dependent methyltransferase
VSDTVSIQEIADRNTAQLTWTEELIRTFWDGVGCCHLDDLSFGKLAGAKFLQFVRDHIPAGAEICDFGAGSGHLAELLLSDGFATGVYEPSPGRGEKLRERLSNYDRFLGVIGPNDRRLFDIVLMTEVVEHVPDRLLEQTLNQVKRLLRDSGIVIVTTPNNENVAQAHVLCPVCRKTFHPWQHLTSFTPQSLEEVLNRNEFERRFLGLVDFSDDAEAIGYGRLIPSFLAFIRLLGEQLAEFARLLPPDDPGDPQSERPSAQLYATDDLQFDHGLVSGEIAKLRARAEAQIRAVPWPSMADELRAAVLQLSDEFYSRLGCLIRAQQKAARIRNLSRSIEIAGGLRSLDRAAPHRRGGFQLGSRGSRIYWAARFCWRLLRHPEWRDEIIKLVLNLGNQARPALGQTHRSEAGGNASAEELEPMSGSAATEASGAAGAVLVHLGSIAQRIEHSVTTFLPPNGSQPTGAGYDLYIGRGSNILYIGEKLRDISS